MTSLALRAYHALPSLARSAAATLRGLYLRSWRYGPESERLVEEALDRERWSAERWQTWREERLAYVLHRAATRVPYYREQWQARRRRGDQASWEVLDHWPVLEKEPLRRHPLAFVADDRDVRRMFHDQTSGTTGTPLDVWKSRGTMRALFALSAARTRIWHGVSPRDRWAMLGGQLVAPVAQVQPPFWVWNAALCQLYMSSYHLGRGFIPHYLDALVRYRVVYLFGYTSSLFALAREASHLGRRLAFTVAITNAEPVTGADRRTIAEAFGCPVRETYGAGESVAAASECQAGQLHLWPEVGLLEVLEGDRPAPAGVTGEFLCTGLLNPDMPLIRYRIGDWGRLPAGDAVCRCGRSLPVLAGVDGRSNDMLVTRDGRRVHWLNPVFYGLPLREAQIVQETVGRIRVLYAPTPEFDAASGRAIADRVRERLGDVEVVLQEVDEIPRGASGKFQAVTSRIPPAEREAVLDAERRMAS
ncbi:MAG: phenylacetate--CoA ligase family protein [Gemmatimonadetes bacterium]|nr:phenylacetate--CoA ligase family protein [Gemmatimonadota bacterium]